MAIIIALHYKEILNSYFGCIMYEKTSYVVQPAHVNVIHSTINSIL